MTVAVSGDSITFPDNSVQATAPKVGMVNRIINGAMVIDQRNAGAAVTPTGSGYTLDRWSLEIAQASKLSIQQNAGAVTPPAGFANYLGATTVSAYTAGTSEVFALRTFVEGYNFADMAWGTASAASVTLSFWVRSSLTGTFGGVLRNDLNNRSYPYTYTISAANTWEQKSVTIAGDTSGTWEKTNQRGVGVFFSLGAGATVSGTAGAWAGVNYTSATGATSVVGTSGATFYITGIDLRKSSTGAYSNGQNDFDYRPYGKELVLCQRYFEKSYSQSTAVGTATDVSTIWGSGQVSSGTTAEIGNGLIFKVVKRAAPTVTFYDNAGASGKGNRILLGASNTAGQSFTANYVGDASTFVNSSGVSANIQAFHYTASAEL